MIFDFIKKKIKNMSIFITFIQIFTIISFAYLIRVLLLKDILLVNIFLKYFEKLHLLRTIWFIMGSVIIPVLILMFNLDFVSCTDDIVQAINRLKEDVEYWQSDVSGLLNDFQANNYHLLSDSELSASDLDNKRFMQEQISFGKKNVAESIKALMEKQEELKAFSESPVVLGKRGASPEADMSNKRSQQ